LCIYVCSIFGIILHVSSNVGELDLLSDEPRLGFTTNLLGESLFVLEFLIHNLQRKQRVPLAFSNIELIIPIRCPVHKVLIQDVVILPSSSH